MSVCRSYLQLISLLSALIDTCANKEIKFNLTVKIDFVEIVYYLKQVFHLLYDKSVMPADALLCFSLVLKIVM